MATSTRKQTAAARKADLGETFGQRVRRLRIAAGMVSPSDLARAIWGEKPDARGFMLANNRDTIWRYENDKGMPSRKNLAKLALALGVPEEELDPERDKRAGSASPVYLPTVELRVVDEPTNRWRLVLDLELPGQLASPVFQMVNEWLGRDRTADVVEATPVVERGTVGEALNNARTLLKKLDGKKGTSTAAPVVAKAVTKASRDLKRIVAKKAKAPAKRTPARVK